MQKQETNVSRGPEKESKMKETTTNFIGEIRKCFFLIAIEPRQSRSTKLRALGWLEKLFCFCRGDKGQSKQTWSCAWNFVNIASAATFLEIRAFPPRRALFKQSSCLQAAWEQLTSNSGRANEFKVVRRAGSEGSLDGR